MNLVLFPGWMSGQTLAVAPTSGYPVGGMQRIQKKL
jgi:hypothetical protein